MGSIKPIFLFLLSTIVSASSSCGHLNPTEQQLLTLSVECFNKQYQSDVHDGHKLSQLVDARLATYRKILQHIKMHKVKHIETSPVIKWAQNREKIFVNFKLSHRQDSPPCSDIRNEMFHIYNIEKVQAKLKVDKTTNQQNNSSMIDFASQCFFTDQKFMFKLKMLFNSTLKAVTIDREGFGTYTLVGEKNDSSIWIDPFEDVHRAAIWQEMRNRYSEEMNEYFEMREKRLQQSEQKTKRRKKKRPVSKQGEKKEEGEEQL